MYMYIDPDEYITETGIDNNCLYIRQRKATREEYKTARHNRLTKELEEAKAKVKQLEYDLRQILE